MSKDKDIKKPKDIDEGLKHIDTKRKKKPIRKDNHKRDIPE